MLDSSAALAMIFGEAGSETAGAALAGAAISAVNLAEMAAKLHESGAPAEEVSVLLAPFIAITEPFDKDQAIATGALRPKTRAAGLSLGDRACLTLAAQRGGPALTADRAWTKVDAGVEVKLIR